MEPCRLTVLEIKSSANLKRKSWKHVSLRQYKTQIQSINYHISLANSKVTNEQGRQWSLVKKQEKEKSQMFEFVMQPLIELIHRAFSAWVRERWIWTGLIIRMNSPRPAELLSISREFLEAKKQQKGWRSS